MAKRALMHPVLREAGEEYLRYNLEKLPESNQHLFKQMYAKGNLNLELTVVIDQMDDEKISWAMYQVDRTLEKGHYVRD